jgi:hypothetical protein
MDSQQVITLNVKRSITCFLFFIFKKMFLLVEYLLTLELEVLFRIGFNKFSIGLLVH